ncbi:MAG: hypothetical protein ABI560_04250 [Myxococcales bacterium]
MSALPPDSEDERDDAPSAAASDEEAPQASGAPEPSAGGDPETRERGGCAEGQRVTYFWSPPPANDTSDRRWSLLALVDDFAALAADLYLRGRFSIQERSKEPDLGKESDDQIV